MQTPLASSPTSALLQQAAVSSREPVSFTVTGGQSDSIASSLRELWQYRPLIAELVRRELKVRYKNRIGGLLWSVFPPLAQVLTITVMVKFFFAPVSNYSAYLMPVMFLWTFFQMSLQDASGSIIANAALARKVYFPRAVLPLVAVVTNLLHLLVALAFTFGYYVYLGTYPQQMTPMILMVVPVSLAVAVLSLGLGLLMARLNTLYEDVRFMSGTVLGLYFYTLPVLYPIERVADKGMLYYAYMCNPMATFLVALQRCVLAPPVVKEGPRVLNSVTFPWSFFAGGTVASLVVLAGGFYYFERSKWLMMERL